MENLLIPANLVQGLLNYLAERPFRESASLIGALQQLRPADKPAEKPELREVPKEAS